MEQIEEQGEKMQRFLCHVSMEINRLCCTQCTITHAYKYTHTRRRVTAQQRQGMKKWNVEKIYKCVLLYYLFQYCLEFDIKITKQDGKFVFI